MEEKLKNLYNSDNVETYKLLQELEMTSSESDELYQYFDKFVEMLKSDKAFVRVRGFRLICSLAQYDKENKINKNINIILNELDDDVSTSVRQCLNKINLVLMYKIELTDLIENKIKNLDLSKYKASMQSLISRDIDKILDK